MKNLLLLNPPFKKKFSRDSRSPAVTKSGTFYYPIWLAYATGLLEKTGFNVKLIDAPAKGLGIRDVLGIIDDFSPAMVAVNTSTPSIYEDIKCAEEIKKYNRDIIIVLVGRHVSSLPEETMSLSSYIDIIALGEYDYTLRDVALLLNSGSYDFAKIEGIIWRKGDKIKKNPMRKPIEDLDNIPFVSQVYLRHLNIYDYFYAHSLYPIVAIVTGRGCPHQCFYCCYPQTLFGHRLRLRSPQDIANEFKFINNHIPFVKEIMIEDDTFTVNKNHVEELAERLISIKNKIPFSGNSRADITDFDLLKKLKKAGCRLLCVGYESGNQEILDSMKKGIKLSKAIEFTKLCKKAGILIHGCFMVGNPGETKETLRQTLEFAKKINPDTVQFYPLIIYPGTEAYNWAKRQGYLLTEDYSLWLDEEGGHATVIERGDLSSEDLINFCNLARREFYLRPSYLLRKILQSVANFSEAERNIKSFKKFVRYLVKK